MFGTVYTILISRMSLLFLKDSQLLARLFHYSEGIRLLVSQKQRDALPIYMYDLDAIRLRKSAQDRENQMTTYAHDQEQEIDI